jgi:hypothetical protein
VIRRRKIPLTPDGKTWDIMTEEERQDFPSDLEAQRGQGPISCHSEEHLVQSDVGVAMLRRMLAQQIKLAQDGGTPLGVAFAEESAWIKTLSGNFFQDAP